MVRVSGRVLLVVLCGRVLFVCGSVLYPLTHYTFSISGTKMSDSICLRTDDAITATTSSFVMMLFDDFNSSDVDVDGDDDDDDDDPFCIGDFDGEAESVESVAAAALAGPAAGPCGSFAGVSKSAPRALSWNPFELWSTPGALGGVIDTPSSAACSTLR